MERISIILKNILKWFISGLLILLPLGATLILLGWLLNFLDSLIGGQSFFGQIWKSGFGWLNLGDTFLFLIAYISLFTFITVIGYFTQGFARYRITSMLRNFFNKIPILNKIYGSFEQLIDLWSKKEKGEETSKMGEVVMVNYANIKAIGILSSPKSYKMNGKDYYLVYLPSSPIPATGFTYFFETSDIEQCNIKMDEMTKVIVSLGVLGQEVLGDNIPLYKIGEKPQSTGTKPDKQKATAENIAKPEEK